MAHPNIDERRSEVKLLLENGTLTSRVRSELAKKYNCSIGAIFSDVCMLNRIDNNPVFASPRTKGIVSKRDNYECQYCGRVEGIFVVDHVIPAFQGGNGKYYNLVYCCASCNIKKKGKTWVPKNISVLEKANPEWASKIKQFASS